MTQATATDLEPHARDEVSTRSERGLQQLPGLADLSSIRRSVVILTVLGCCGFIWAAQDILVPTALAVVLALILTPIIAALERWRIPTVVATGLVVLLAIGMVIAAALIVAPSAADWVKRAPEITRTIERKLLPLKRWMANYESATDKLSQITNVNGGSKGATIVATPMPDSSILETAPAGAAQLFYVIVLALFLIAVRRQYYRRLILLPRELAERVRVAHILNDSLDQVSDYLFTMMCISIGLAVTASLCFAIAGIEQPILWGMLFGAASFVPYVGPTAVIVGCSFVQFASQATLADAAVGPLLLLALNTIESNFVTPQSRRPAR